MAAGSEILDPPKIPPREIGEDHGDGRKFKRISTDRLTAYATALAVRDLYMGGYAVEQLPDGTVQHIGGLALEKTPALSVTITLEPVLATRYDDGTGT